MPDTLFYSPGACSMVSHIALEESGAPFELARIMLAEGDHLKADYLAINPHARVPALATDRGVITENIAILNFIGRRGGEGAVPAEDAFQEARCNELLGWFASSVHIAFAEIFRPMRFAADEAIHPAIQQGGRDALLRYFAEIDERCGDGWLAGDRFTAADSYALTFYRWGRRIGLDMEAYPRWKALVRRVLERPAVQQVLASEGLSSDEFA